MKKFLINILRKLGVKLDRGHYPPVTSGVLTPNMVREGKKINPVLTHYNENWVLVERYANMFDPPDFHLIFKRDEAILNLNVSEDIWRAFDGIELLRSIPKESDNKSISTESDKYIKGSGTQGHWRVVKELEQPARIVAYGLGRWQDEFRTIATMADNSILSLEDAYLIVYAVNGL